MQEYVVMKEATLKVGRVSEGKITGIVEMSLVRGSAIFVEKAKQIHKGYKDGDEGPIKENRESRKNIAIAGRYAGGNN